MNYLIVDIYQGKLDFIKDDFLFEKNHLYSSIYIINDYNSDFENNLCSYVLEKKGDGVYIFSQLINNLIFLTITLIQDDSNIDYLKEFFDNKYEKSSFSPKIDSINYEYNNYIKIESPDCGDDNFDEVCKYLESKLQSNNITYNFLSKSHIISEHGAGGEIISIIIGVVDLSTSIYNKINDYLKNKKDFEYFITYGDFNIKKLLFNLAKKINEQNFNNIKRIIIEDFNESEDNTYKVILKDKFFKYEIKCDKESNIINLKKYQYRFSLP